MATNYGIQMKQYNGTDYDNLYPNNGLTGTTDPTTSTVAYFLGQTYLNTATQNLWQCTAINSGVYTWNSIPTTLENFHYIEFLSSANWTAPSNIKNNQITVLCCGGGGGGEWPGTGGNTRVGGGGGSGYISKATLTIAPNQTYTITIGAGGSAHTAGTSSSSVAGGNGGNTSFDTLLSANGGYGASNYNGGNGEAGGGGGVYVSSGYEYTYGKGGNGNVYGGGGGTKGNSSYIGIGGTYGGNGGYAANNTAVKGTFFPESLFVYSIIGSNNLYYNGRVQSDACSGGGGYGGQGGQGTFGAAAGGGGYLSKAQDCTTCSTGGGGYGGTMSRGAGGSGGSWTNSTQVVPSRGYSGVCAIWYTTV